MNRKILILSRVLIFLTSLIYNKDISSQLSEGTHYALSKYFELHENMKQNILHLTGIDTLINLHNPYVTSIFDDFV